MHESQAAAAVRGIERNGRDVSVVTELMSGPAYAPTVTATTVTVRALQVRRAQAEFGGELVRTSDRRYLIAGPVVIPVDARLIDDGTELSVVDVEQIKPGERLLLQRITAR